MCLLWGTNRVFISQKTAFFIVTAVKTSNLTLVHAFIISTSDRGHWQAWRSCRSPCDEQAVGAHSRGAWVGPKVGVDAVECRKSVSPRMEMNHGRPARSSLLYRPSSYVTKHNTTSMYFGSTSDVTWIWTSLCNRLFAVATCIETPAITL
jgi:hypothetical protein